MCPTLQPQIRPWSSADYVFKICSEWLENGEYGWFSVYTISQGWATQFASFPLALRPAQEVGSLLLHSRGGVSFALYIIMRLIPRSSFIQNVRTIWAAALFQKNFRAKSVCEAWRPISSDTATWMPQSGNWKPHYSHMVSCSNCIFDKMVRSFIFQSWELISTCLTQVNIQYKFHSIRNRCKQRRQLGCYHSLITFIFHDDL